MYLTNYSYIGILRDTLFVQAINKKMTFKEIYKDKNQWR